MHAQSFACGPLDVTVAGTNARFRDKIAETLELYNVKWGGSLEKVCIHIHDSSSPVPLGAGNYLTCARMHVDPDNESLRATFRSGASAHGTGSTWNVFIPQDNDDWTLIDMESFVSLVLTEGWRARGWIPIHGAAITRDDTCAVICAESGGGKTSLTAAMIRNGWKTLGDDKLLLRKESTEGPELRALVHTFNLHPRTRGWFPEVGDLERLDVYSQWTEKRKVLPENIWPGTTLTKATLTHLIQLSRVDDTNAVRITSMSDADVLSSLLRQTVVPNQRSTAKQIIETVAKSARSLRGLKVEVGNDVYNNPNALQELEGALS